MTEINLNKLGYDFRFFIADNVDAKAAVERVNAKFLFTVFTTEDLVCWRLITEAQFKRIMYHAKLKAKYDKELTLFE